MNGKKPGNTIRDLKRFFSKTILGELFKVTYLLHFSFTCPKTDRLEPFCNGTELQCLHNALRAYPTELQQTSHLDTSVGKTDSGQGKP